MSDTIHNPFEHPDFEAEQDATRFNTDIPVCSCTEQLGDHCEIHDFEKPPPTQPSSSFVKTKAGKLSWCLLPWIALREVVRVFMFGADKHTSYGWKGVPDARDVYYDATMRHLIDWYEGKDVDGESGLHPLAHCVADALILLARHFEGTL